jgi:hypothetical protein
LVRAPVVVVPFVLAKYEPQMFFAEKNEMVQALALDRLHPPFGRGIEIRSHGANRVDGDGIGSENRIATCQNLTQKFASGSRINTSNVSLI